MNLLINKFETITGWSGTIPVSLNQHKQYIAHNNVGSVMLTPDLDLNGTVSLTLSQALTGYEYIVLNCQSIYKGINKLTDPADCNYLIDFGFQKYYFPAPPKFGLVKFRIAGTETITKIEITALHNDRDVLFLSNLQTIKEELPLDIVNAIKSEFTPVEYSAGTATATAGQKTITFSSLQYIDRYCKVKLGSYYYSIEKINGNVATINTLYDGVNGIAANFSGTAYMSPSVEIYSQFKEAVLPGITIYDDTPELLDIDSRDEYRLDTYKYNSPSQDTVDVVNIKDNYALPIQIDAESQYLKVLHDLSSLIKNFVAKRTVWVNGVQLEVTSLSVQRIEGEYEKIAYIITVEYAEEIWQETQNFPLTGTTTWTINPVAL
jgi:hypothetical protein